ncbi:icarapin-like [Ischnura elegans]|uniref:icarapin-like n=1 Tax=Ischnura elegans TaxID=197161 RepID=UPI001ED87E7C|nr:icarapin-like [Ischnura elegans]
MARVSCVLLLFSLVALAASFPSSDQQWRSPSQDDVVIVPLEGGRPRDVEESSEEDFGVRRSPDDYESPWSGSFSNFFQGMQAMMWQLRNQMQEVLRRIPQESLEGSSGFEIAQPWNGIPGNSTSTTKVINGHVVTVNETTYTRGTNGSSAVFHIKVVDIKPQQSAQEGENESPSAETVEVMDSLGSLPSQNSQSSEDSDELSSAMARWREMARNPIYAPRRPGIKSSPKKPVYHKYFGHESQEDDSSANRLDGDVEEFERKYGEGNNSPVIDLSRDTLVNQLMSDQQSKGGLVAVHPDAEILDVEDGKVLGTVDDMLQQKSSKPTSNKPYGEKLYWRPKFDFRQ